MRTLYKIGSKKDSPEQIQKALSFCCKNLEFEKYTVLDISQSEITITYTSNTDSELIFNKQKLVETDFRIPLIAATDDTEAFDKLPNTLKHNLEKFLNCQISLGIYCHLQNNIGIERILIFFSTDEQCQKLDYGELREQFFFIIPYLSTLLEREDFKKLLQQDKFRFQKIIQDASISMALLDRDMRFISCNKEWLIQNQISNPNITGKLISEVMPCYPERWNSVHLSCLEGKLEINRDDMYVQQDGRKRYLRWTATPWLDLRGQINGVIITTDSNEELAQKRDLALKSSKMKTEFLANMSHEIRTPLNGIICISELLMTTNLDEKQLELAKMIKSCSDALCSIVTEILDISKIESGALELEKTSFALNSLIEEVNSIYLPLMNKKGILFSVHKNILPERLFLGDPTKIRQILHNLLSNALKFTQKGNVTLYCNEVAFNQEESQITFIIADSGIGLDEDQMKSIFAPFKQAEPSINRKFGGSGLGLYITKKLVQLMGGDIKVQSKYNSGSTFTANFNLKHAKTLDHNIKITPLNQENHFISQPSILLVEDNQINQKVVLMYLQRLGFSADTATDGIDAVQACVQNHYDLILMDCQMDGMDGYAATKQIREMQKSHNEKMTRIIAVTANASVEDMNKCHESGMDDYLPKPIKFDKFAEIIKKNLH
jgi:signal transduction histidine kinase/ActR/RegA family two-component response regulator